MAAASTMSPATASATSPLRSNAFGRVMMDAGWTQAWCHAMVFTIILPAFFIGEYWDLNTATYQGVCHLVLGTVTLAWLRTCGQQDAETGAYGTGEYVNNRRATGQYWHACLWAFLQHTDYFIIFMCRNLLSESDPSDARPERAMENEIATLNTMFLQPLGFTQSSESMVNELGQVTKSFAGSSGTGMFFQNGELLFWFQIYEGIIHGLIIIGALVHLFGLKGKIAEQTTFWCYEMGMVLELVTYGPAYFWMITVMLVGSFVPAAVGMSFAVGPSVRAMATIFCTHHHVGYCLDTWGCFQITQAWGLAPAYTQQHKTAKTN